ncbi:MAG: hypothetical protein KH142_00850 [Slackia piriformis]|uniref:Uncharacterized protein n=1 Tax=Slackia piriformis TaxID=626934 RepID=A0A943YXB6_9ACTN|nr:hypothetical protein [Slackia piriformis]
MKVPLAQESTVPSYHVSFLYVIILIAFYVFLQKGNVWRTDILPDKPPFRQDAFAHGEAIARGDAGPTGRPHAEGIARAQDAAMPS